MDIPDIQKNAGDGRFRNKPQDPGKGENR